MTFSDQSAAAEASTIASLDGPAARRPATAPRLTDPLPGSELQAFETFTTTLAARSGEETRVRRLLTHIDRVIPLSKVRMVSVLGCGPKPDMIPILGRAGFDVVGIEPVPMFVEAARKLVGTDGRILAGSAEVLPLETESQDLVFFENVLEHVESPRICLAEVFRVLKPGGLVFLTTTNRLKFHPTGRNNEFNVPFFNWFPGLLKESYVHRQLHFEPELANMTERPAVHWFSFADLCALGRDAGFARFYSTLDTRAPEDMIVSRNPIRRMLQGSARLLRMVQRRPFLRTLALTQSGGDIMMCKRSAE